MPRELKFDKNQKMPILQSGPNKYKFEELVT